MVFFSKNFSGIGLLKKGVRQTDMYKESLNQIEHGIYETANYLVLKCDTFTGPSIPFKLPRRNLVTTAIQKLVLRPNSVLKMTLK